MSTTNYKTVEMIAIKSSTIKLWRDQLQNLKPKKRKNWKSNLVDKWGGKTKVIYKMEEDKFYNWSTIAHCWAEVIDHGSLFQHTINGNNCERLSDQSPMMQNVYKAIDAIEEETGRKLTIEEKEDITKRVLKLYMHRNHTGNHVPLAERDAPNKRRYACPSV
jgi:hypothetical protein